MTTTSTTKPKSHQGTVVVSPEREPSSDEFEQLSFSARATTSVRAQFQRLGDGALPAREFFPETKVHTSYGADVAALPQSEIPCATKEYRLRSNHLAQTLQLFGHKVSEILPEGYSVQIDISPLGGSASGDSVFLIRRDGDGKATSILERSYLPFDGGGIGWMLPTDEARNTMLFLEERLFYYKSFLAIKKALQHERVPPQSQRAER